MNHDGSAYLSTKKAIEAAEDRGFDAGREVGIAEGIRMAAELLDQHGHKMGAQRLREAKLITIREAANG